MTPPLRQSRGLSHKFDPDTNNWEVRSAACIDDKNAEDAKVVEVVNSKPSSFIGRLGTESDSHLESMKNNSKKKSRYLSKGLCERKQEKRGGCKVSGWASTRNCKEEAVCHES